MSDSHRTDENKDQEDEKIDLGDVKNISVAPMVGEVRGDNSRVDLIAPQLNNFLEPIDDDAKSGVKMVHEGDKTGGHHSERVDDDTARALFQGRIDLLKKQAALDLSNSRNDVLPVRT